MCSSDLNFLIVKNSSETIAPVVDSNLFIKTIRGLFGRKKKGIFEYNGALFNSQMFATPICGKESLLIKNGTSFVAMSVEGEDFSLWDIDITNSMKFLHDAPIMSPHNFALYGFINDNGFSVADVIYLNEYVFDKPISERLSLLNSVNFTGNIKKAEYVSVSNSEESERVSDLMENLMLRNDEYDVIISNAERNEKFFDSWKPDMAYFLGLLTSDGSLDEEGNRIEFTISKLDLSLITKLGNALGKDSVQDHNGSARFRFGSEYMVKRLKELGFAALKPDRTTYNHVPSNLKWLFARGVFDADGSVPKDRIQIDSSNKGLLKWVDNLFSTVAKDVKVYDYDTYAKLVVMHEEAQKVLSKLYSGNPGLGLKRKQKEVK